jgi:hypothetical protein
LEYKIDGFYKHRNFPWIFNFGEPFINLICDVCSRIPHELDFREKVIQEDATIVKRGARGRGFGRRLGYLSIHELFTHSCAICKKYQTAKFAHWYQKGIITQLKMSRPSFKASSLECLKRNDVFQFCSNILSTHHTNSFGGKLALWDFLKYVARNVN